MNLEKTGWKSIYVGEFSDGTIKIGVSVDPNKRLLDISRSSGKKLVNKFFTDPCSNPFVIENLSHREFDNVRIKGEWFRTDYDNAVKAVKKIYAEHHLEDVFERKFDSIEGLKAMLFPQYKEIESTKDDKRDKFFCAFATEVLFGLLETMSRRLEESNVTDPVIAYSLGFKEGAMTFSHSIDFDPLVSFPDLDNYLSEFEISLEQLGGD